MQDEESVFDVIEDGEEGLPPTAQKFKDWFEEEMAWAYIEVIDGEDCNMMPSFDYDLNEDEFLDVELDKYYMTWKAAIKSVETAV